MTSETVAPGELSTRDRILEVASGLFIEQGYDATSLREIADRLGFTKAALYYHFPSKEDLLDALVAPGEAVVRELIERLEGADGREGWASVLSWLVGQLSSHVDFFKLLYRNRAAISKVAAMRELHDHGELHERLEAAVAAKATSLSERVRMVAALGAVTGFDDWAPELLTTTDPAELAAEMERAVRDILELPRRRPPRRASTVTESR